MWIIILCVIVTLIIVYITHWCYKWMNPNCSGTLPPGSMGFPLIGETIQFLKPSHSLDILPFFNQRIQRYGPLFRTSLAGRPVFVSADPDVNQFLFQQEGKSVEMWYLDTFAQLFRQDGTCNANGHIHKYLRDTILIHFGHENLKEKLLNEAENKMIFDFITMELFSYDPDKTSNNMNDAFMNFLEGLMAFPIDLPGTTFRKCLKTHRKVLNMIRDIVMERLASPGTRHGDLLDCFVEDMKKEEFKFLNVEFIVYTIFGLIFASFDTIPSTLMVAIKLIEEHPLVLQELMDEHEAIIQKRREHTSSLVTWQEYKSMSFTFHVINETLRMANVGIGIFRRTLKDVVINGYTIPKDWAVLMVPAALHMDPNTFTDPLLFNPSRWKEDMGLKPKNFTPFGGGVRSCTGAEFSKMFMAMFLHVLITNYRWEKIKGGGIIRQPVLLFEEGYHIKLSEKNS